MIAIGVKNVRSLEATELIPIKPITLLVGANSAGKSTFLRLIPLLKQSLEARTRGPVLWYGRYVDFGSYDEARNKVTRGNIELTYLIPIKELLLMRRRLYKDIKDGFEVRVDVEIGKNDRTGSSYTKRVSLTLFDYRIDIEAAENRRVDKYQINGRDMLEELNSRRLGQYVLMLVGGMIPIIRETRMVESQIEVIDERIEGIFRDELLKYADANISSENFARILTNIKLDRSDLMLGNLQKSNTRLQRWTRRISSWTVDNPDFMMVRDLYIASIVPNILNTCEAYMSNTMRMARYIEPIRAAAERFYRFQDLAIDEVDPQGSNLALVLRNLNARNMKELSDWVETHFQFGLQIEETGSHYAIKITDPETNLSTSLADMGFGFSQLLPILVQLWMTVSRRADASNGILRRGAPVIIAIEQPELHLHPKFQAKFADLLVHIIDLTRENSLDIRLIIETHSETIINRLGARVYKKDLSEENVSVLIFNKDNKTGNTKLSTSVFDNDGYLSNWPIGFFSAEKI